MIDAKLKCLCYIAILETIVCKQMSCVELQYLKPFNCV